MNFIADFKDVQFSIFLDLRFLSLGLCEGTGVCPPSSCIPRGTYAENQYRTADCYPRHAAACLGGAGVPN